MKGIHSFKNFTCFSSMNVTLKVIVSIYFVLECYDIVAFSLLQLFKEVKYLMYYVTEQHFKIVALW